MSLYDSGQTSAKELLISGAKGLAVGIILGAVLLFSFAAIAYGMTDPDSVTEPLGYAALYISAVAAGIAAARFSREMGAGAAVAGGAAGVMMLILLILMSFIPAEAPKEPLSPIITVLMYAAVPAAAALSGFILRKKQSRKPRHRRRR